MARNIGFAVAVGIIAGSLHLGAEQPVAIKVRPAVMSWKQSARLVVYVERNEANRSLVWEVDGPSYYRSSSLELTGAASPRTYVFTLTKLPAGEFEIRATVRRNDDSRAIDRSVIRVIGPELDAPSLGLGADARYGPATP
jgi:hypothetical protein